MTEKLEYALRQIASCDLCNGHGNHYWAQGEDFDAEACVCNPYEIILDHDGDVIWDNGLLGKSQLFATAEAN